MSKKLYVLAAFVPVLVAFMFPKYISQIWGSVVGSARKNEAGAAKKIGRSLTDTLIEENEEKKEEKPKPKYNENPESIQDLGYDFNAQGQLRSIDKGEKFTFVDQKHYELLGDLVFVEIQKIMAGPDYRASEKLVPVDPQAEDEKRSNIFLSEDFATNEDKLLVLICGSGAVRAGQWARSLCINADLDTGSVLPYLRDARDAGYSYIVLNPNFRVRGSQSAEEHVQYVWDHFISQSPAKEIYIVAHSYGGVATVRLLADKPEVLSQLVAVAFTDSVHSMPRNYPRASAKFLSERARNWAASKEPLDTELFERAGCDCVSAGHHVHEHTSASCKDSVFKFFQSFKK